MSAVPHPVIVVPGGMGSKLFDHHPRPHENWLSLLRIMARNLIAQLLDPICGTICYGSPIHLIWCA